MRDALSTALKLLLAVFLLAVGIAALALRVIQPFRTPPCNPETLARDLLYLTKHGYRAQECQPVDMFPWTKHIECVVALHRVDM